MEEDKIGIIKIVLSRILNIIALVFIVWSIIWYYQHHEIQLTCSLITLFCLVVNILLNPFPMKTIDKATLNKMAETLADPNVSVDDLKAYKEKAKIMIETVEMAQEAENRQLRKVVNGLVSGRL